MRSSAWQKAHGPKKYPVAKSHDMSEAAKAAVRANIESIEDRGKHADVHTLAARHHCSPSQVAGIKAAMHRNA
jgi:hypothetical protein